jgi:lipoyl(octanoyl) transferase
VLQNVSDLLLPAINLAKPGLIDFETALTSQREIHQGVAEGKIPNTLILLEHPSVYTAGRRTTPEERPTDGTPVIDADRGGKITWHGPGQIVGYPIVKLRERNNVVGFVRELEEGLIRVCAEFGINAERYCERTGVWIRDEKGDRKVAAIGIRVAKGVTMHGFSLNIEPDLSYFNNIIPCGIFDAGVTSFAKELGQKISVNEVMPVVERHIFEVLTRVAERN